MKIFVEAKPRAHETRVEKVNDTHFIVSVVEPPVEGRANRAIIRALAEFFKVSPAEVRLVGGYMSRQKIIEIK